MPYHLHDVWHTHVLLWLWVTYGKASDEWKGHFYAKTLPLPIQIQNQLLFLDTLFSALQYSSSLKSGLTVRRNLQGLMYSMHACIMWFEKNYHSEVAIQTSCRLILGMGLARLVVGLDTHESQDSYCPWVFSGTEPKAAWVKCYDIMDQPYS